MKKSFSFDYMIDNQGCYSEVKNKTENLFFYKTKEDISINDIINSSIPLKDKFWFVIRKTELTKHKKQQIAIDVAEIVLPIYENIYPDNKSPREAIEAAKLYISGHISLELLIEKRRAAYAAYAAADAAAYDAAAYAADAAAYAAYAAAYAADDAADAAADYAYAAAYDDCTYTEKLLSYLKSFVENN